MARWIIQNPKTWESSHPTRRLTPTERAYIAGLVDGEGSIMIGRIPTKTLKHGFKFACYISIANNARNLIDYCQKVLGNIGSIQIQKPKKKTHSPSYLLRVWRYQQVEGLLKQILPYLILKKPQAKLTLEWINLRRTAKKGSCYSDREMGIYQEMKKLNHRGCFS